MSCRRRVSCRPVARFSAQQRRCSGTWLLMPMTITSGSGSNSSFSLAMARSKVATKAAGQQEGEDALLGAASPRTAACGCLGRGACALAGCARLARAHVGEGVLCGFLLGHLLAGAGAGAPHLPIDAHLCAELVVAAATLLVHDALHLAADFLAPLQQAALAVLVLARHFLELHMLQEHRHDDPACAF